MNIVFIWLIFSVVLGLILYYRGVMPRFIWFDLWIGFYYSQESKTLYFCPLPTIVYEINLGDQN